MIRIQDFFDSRTATLTYVVWDEASRDAVVIDPVLDYDQPSSKVSEESALKVIEFLRQKNLRLHFILETHAHADHLSGSQVLKREFPQAKVAIGERITEVQKVFKDLLHLPSSFPTDGSQFDRLIKDHEQVMAGTLEVRAIPTPGHTPACMSFLIGENLFTGDALFIPDLGTGRCDFPRGSAAELYQSVHERIYALPDQTRIYVGHDYLPNGRPLRISSTVAESKSENTQLKAATTFEEYVKFRTDRDKTLSAPKLLYPSILVNIAAGHLPEPESNGKRYLKVPIS